MFSSGSARCALVLCCVAACSETSGQGDSNELEPSEQDIAQGATWPMPNRPNADLPNPRQYQVLSDDVVLDEVTGLSWQRKLESQFFDWSGAKSYCEGLELDGDTDWRLPSRIELVSIISLEWVDPAIDEDIFPNTPSDWFWSSTPSAADPDSAWYVYFYFGYPGTDLKEVTFSVRCVRSDGVAPEGPRYALSDEVVRDEFTGLVWQRRPSEDLFSFDEAQDYCENLELAGKSAWRAPSMLELQSIVDPSQSQPAIQPVVFPDTSAVEFWSSTPWTETPDLRGWYVDFRDGSALYLIGTTPQRVRCVH